MNKNAYLAELTQLLYYMTPWDRDAAIEACRQRFDSCDDPEALVQVLGKPMKLAVTLHRTYAPTPQPPEGETAPLPPLPVGNVPPKAPEPAPRPTPEEPESPVTGAAQPAPEAPENTPAAPEPDAALVPDTPEETEKAPAEEPVPPVEEAPAPAPPAPARDEPHEEIFSEIFNAATMAQSAIVTASASGEDLPVKARMGVLIPYTIVCVLVGIPVSVLLFAVDILIFAIAIAALAGGVFCLAFLGEPQFAAPGDKLVIIGMAILAITASAAIAALGVWFLKNASLGFPRFLAEFGRKHCYTKGESA